MALINCPECKNEVSDKAQMCPKCAYPINSEIKRLEEEIYNLKNNSIMPESVEIQEEDIKEKLVIKKVDAKKEAAKKKLAAKKEKKKKKDFFREERKKSKHKRRAWNLLPGGFIVYQKTLNKKYREAQEQAKKENYQEAEGTHTYSNGNKYLGEWKDKKRHGQGTFTFTDGSKYVGEWKNDKQNGLGTFTYADGTVKSGLFENNEFIGE